MITLYKLFDPVKKWLTPKDKIMIPIFYSYLRAQHPSQQKDKVAPHAYDKDNNTPSSLIRSSATINIPAQRQVLVAVHAKLYRLGCHTTEA